MWSQMRIKQLKRLYPRLDANEIAKIIGVGAGQIEKKATELGLEKSDELDSFWDFLDESMLHELHLSYNEEQLGRIFGKTEEEIKAKIKELGLVKSSDWTNSDIDALKGMYSIYSNKSLGVVLGKSPMEIEHFAFRMGLRKSKSFFANVTNSAEEIALAKQANEEYHKGLNVSRGHYVTSRILDYLFPNHKIVPEEQINGLRLDLTLPDFNLAFEYDGIQHSQYVDFFYKDRFEFERAKERDYAKSRMCEERGIAIVRLYHDEDLSVGLVRAKIAEVM